jgi:zinc/manganese transport system permease protein
MSEFFSLMAAPFAACIVLVGIHAYLGLHVLEREVIFVDLALAQLAALGSAVAVLIGCEPDSGTAYLLSLGVVFVGASLFTLVRGQRYAIPQEAIIGITFAVSSAAGILVLDQVPHGAEHLQSMLVGSILWVSWQDVLQLSVLYALLGVFYWLFRARFEWISTAAEDAPAPSWSLRWWDFLFYASFGVVITQSVSVAGVFSFLIVPAVCAALFAQSFQKRLAIAWGVGLAASGTGISLSYLADLPTGATVVCTFGIVLVLLGAFKMLRGMR